MQNETPKKKKKNYLKSCGATHRTMSVCKEEKSSGKTVQVKT